MNVFFVFRRPRGKSGSRRGIIRVPRDAIERLDDPKERHRQIEAGQKYVQRFSLDREVDKLVTILGRVAGG